MSKITVRTKSGTFRRAGIRFTESPTELDTESLKKGALDAIEAEPLLVVEGAASKSTGAKEPAKKKAAAAQK